MKSFRISILILLATGLTSVYAQDVITLRNGEQIKAKVTEISTSEIRYKQFEHLDGPTRVISLTEVFAINYENGTREVIKPVSKTNETQTASQTSERQTTNETNKKQPTATAPNTNRKFRIGVRVGMNFSNVSGFDGLSKMIFGMQSGIVADYTLPKNFSLQAGLLYTQQGFKMTGTYVRQKSTRRWTLHYIQMPVNAQYKLALGSKTSLLFQAGTYFGFCFLGIASDKDITLPIRMGYSERDELKTFDFGLGVGVGVQFYGLQVGVGYNIGLYNLRPSNFSDKLRNHGLVITTTYLFGK